MSDFNYLEAYEGQGTEELRGGIPFLSICQKAKEEQPEKKLGQWWHSSLGIALGKEVRVIPLGWREVWVEKDTNGKTISYHLPQSINLKSTGQGKTFKLTNKDTGNKVDCTFVISLILPDHEESLCLYSPSVKSLSQTREWRKGLSMNRLTNGGKAPIFSNVWTLKIGKISDGNDYYVLSGITKNETVPFQFFESGIKPLLADAQNPVELLPAPSEISVTAEIVQEDEGYLA